MFRPRGQGVRLSGQWFGDLHGAAEQAGGNVGGLLGGELVGGDLDPLAERNAARSPRCDGAERTGRCLMPSMLDERSQCGSPVTFRSGIRVKTAWNMARMSAWARYGVAGLGLWRDQLRDRQDRCC